MTQNKYGMLWHGDVQAGIDYFEAKYGHKVTFVASDVLPNGCPADLWVRDNTIRQGNVLIGATEFLPRD